MKRTKFTVALKAEAVKKFTEIGHYVLSKQHSDT